MRLLLVATLGACVSSPSRPRTIESTAASRPRPKLFCPRGTYEVGGRPPEEFALHCERSSGVKHGPYVYWFENGQKEEEGSYWEGELRGRRAIWDENGELVDEDVLGAPIHVCAYDPATRRAIHHFPILVRGPKKTALHMDDSGRASARRLPVGTYLLEWWSGTERRGPSTREVAVDLEREQLIHVEVDVSRLPPVVLGGPSPCAPPR